MIIYVFTHIVVILGVEGFWRFSKNILKENWMQISACVTAGRSDVQL